MICRCGHVFQTMRNGQSTREFRDAFCLIPNREYRKFLKWEIKAMEADTEEKRLRALGKSSAMVGNLTECPSCGRILLQLPDSDEIECLVRERAARQTRPRRHSRT